MRSSQSNPIDSLRGLERQVWVDLTNLYRLPVDESREGELLPRLGQELLLEGEVAGTLHEWTRSARGLWLGVVSFGVLFSADRSQRFYLQRQLVPHYALRPKTVSPHRRAP